MQVRARSEIPDQEYLLYSVYEQGSKKIEFRMVTLFEGDRTARAYLDLHPLDSKEAPPSSYRDFPSYSIVDLQRGSMLSLRIDQYAYRVEQKNEEGPFCNDLIIAGTKSTNVRRSWNGREIHEEISSVEDLDPRYPVWSIEAFALWGGRVMDWSKGGSILAIFR